MKGVFRDCYDILIKVYRESAYLNLIMKENSNKRVAKIVFGVLDKHFELNYIINQLSVKGVKPSIRPVLLIGSYSLLYLDTPQNLVINEINELLESLGKIGIKDFTSAILLKVSQRNYEMPAKSNKNFLEVKYNLPSWLVGMYRKDYPDTFEDLIAVSEFNKIHIYPNKNTTNEDIVKADRNCEKTLTGYFVGNNKEISLLNYLGKISYMSYGSTLIAESMVGKGKTLLDCCSAPGGKAVYLNIKGMDVTACDVIEHRIDLIRSYASRMKANIDVYMQDATKFVPKWENNFDIVLVDAPCSGFGVTGKKKDIIFNKTYDDILELAVIQQNILQNASQYVKSGGLLVYSTCTIFKKENSDNIDLFLANNNQFSKVKIDLPWENEGEIQFLPDGKGMEGFYLCQMIKN